MRMARQLRRYEAPVVDPALDHLPPLLRRVYAHRGVRAAEEIDYALAGLLPVDRLSGIPRAVDLLEDALRAQRRILVLGDFDVDGATSTALALLALRAMGARDVHYLVPNRFEYGYGLTPAIVEVAAGISPDLLVTVDNGVSSIEGVEAAHAHGMQVLVTDHHLPGERLPAADAIVDPNLPGDPFPSKALAGVGVIFYVMLALRSRLRGCGWFEQSGIADPNLGQFLDLVALGTVADVAALDRNNRILVEQGLRRIRQGRCRPGIRAILDVAGRATSRLRAVDLGFVLGPRLNAAGRLDDMSVGIECLLSDDPARARELAIRLDGLNRERKDIEADMQAQALDRLGDFFATVPEQLPSALCLYEPDWHQGVIGILASRIKDRTHRPVIAFADAGDGELKGSARSIQGVHIRDVLDSVAARWPGLISRFGGHAMAAGLSLPSAHLEIFREALDLSVQALVDPDQLQAVVHSDGPLAVDEIGLDGALMIRDGGPWGQGFPEPVFDGEFELISKRIVGERHLRLRLRAAGGREIDAIAFNAAIDDWPERGGRVCIAYRLDVNEYQGRLSPQLVVEELLS
ncbi:MAG: single-stranded-DNA-specific exonuclease RecJ [Ectothiorhodospiraceae bacterium]|nr:single-stranded-DNA-specific exonuclease RecJ [Ectothiorhodospiraceae bacterium]